MQNKWTPIVTFLAGVVLTVAIYETSRLVQNTSNALSVASSQMKGGEPSAQAPTGLRKPVRREPRRLRTPAAEVAGKPYAMQEGSDPPVATPQVMNTRPISPDARRQVLRHRLDSMSADEREAWRQRRMQRRQRQRERMAAARAMQEGEAPLAMPVEQPSEPGEAMAPVEEVVDTGL